MVALPLRKARQVIKRGTQGVPITHAAGFRPSSNRFSMHPEWDAFWPPRLLLSHASPRGFDQALSWKGDRSLWRAPEASADSSIFPRLFRGWPHVDVGNLLLVISAQMSPRPIRRSPVIQLDFQRFQEVWQILAEGQVCVKKSLVPWTSLTNA